MSSDTRSRISRRRAQRQTFLYAPIQIKDLLNLVAAVGHEPKDIDAHLQRIYDWRHARGLAVAQLAFAPAAVAALAVLAKGASTDVIIGATVIVVVSVGVGLWRINYVNLFDSEYALALRLGRELAPFHRALASHCRGEVAASGAVSSGDPSAELGSALYDQIGDITLLDYLSDGKSEGRVRQTLVRMRGRLVSDPEV